LFFINFITVIFKNKNFSHIVPSYFIPSVGIVVACVSGKVFNMQNLCNAIFFFGFFSYMVTLLLVIVRLAKEELPKPKQSTLAIMAAPASLCLAGLLTITKTPNPILLYILVPLAFAMTIYVYYKMFHLLKIPFNPGYSAYTFPLVISAIATLKLAGYMKSITFSFAPFVKQFGIVQLLIATALVAYVALRYLHFYLIPTKK
jgi:tellurite resistance protein TehA-like permease